MKRLTSWCAQLTACFLLAAATALPTQAADADPTGTWTWTQQGETQNGSFTQKYKGKVTADAITGKISFDRGGETTERDWVAKRKKEAAK
jgi:hypothetical protein